MGQATILHEQDPENEADRNRNMYRYLWQYLSHFSNKLQLPGSCWSGTFHENTITVWCPV